MYLLVSGFERNKQNVFPDVNRHSYRPFNKKDGHSSDFAVPSECSAMNTTYQLIINQHIVSV